MAGKVNTTVAKDIDEIDDSEFVDSSLKIDLIKKEYIIKNKYYPIIEKNIPINEKNLLKHIARYRDKNITILSSPYPLHYPIWGVQDEQIIYECTGIYRDDIEKDIQIVKDRLPNDLKDKKPNFTPFSTIMVLLMKYYIENLQEDKLNMIYYYMAYSMYWSIFTKYFRTYKPREETMIYTINNLSNKFILKKLASMDQLLYYSVNNTIEAYRQRVKRSSDAELYYIIDALKTRLNNYFNKIKNEYEKNDKSRNVIFKSDELNDDNTMRDVNSLSGSVESLANEYTNKFFSSSPNQKLIERACKLTSISVSELRTTLNLLLSNQRIDEVKQFYSALFYIYLSEEGTTIDTVKSIKFLGVMEKLYRKSNTNNKNIVIVKTLMDEWLREGSKTYRASNREATLNYFRKAIYYYFIFSVTNNK